MISCANPLAQYDSYTEEIDRAIKRVLTSGNYILGAEVEAFEQSFAVYCDVNHVVGVASGTDALILALRALGISAGDEVITVSHTALATVAAIIACGATPVLVDIDPEYYTMDPECFRRAITEKTKAVIPVHLYGQPADMDEIVAIAKLHGLYVIEDCAQATGATYKGKRVGSIGDIGCFSFYPTKNLGAIGDAGAITTRSADVASRIRRLRQYGWDVNRNTQEPGLNSRIDEVQAAILNIKLQYLDRDNERRRKIAHTYNQILSNLQIDLPIERLNCAHVFHLYVVAVNNRDALKIKLAENGVFAGIHYQTPVHLHSGYNEKCIYSDKNLLVTMEVINKILSLPMYPEITSSQLEVIKRSIIESVY